jgi:hypothetical protein
MAKSLLLMTLLLALCASCTPSPVECDLASTTKIDGVCVGNGVDSSICRNGTHWDVNGCVADNVEIPEEVTCGLCTLLNMLTSECVADLSCDPEEIDPASLCLPGTVYINDDGCVPECNETEYWDGSNCNPLPDPTDCPNGMRYNAATGDCEVDYENLDFMIRCADQNGCHEQGCEPPHWWIYTSGSDFVPDCECPADHEPVKPTPSCCMAVDNQQKGGGYCVSDSFNPYPEDTPVAPELSVQCWDKVDGGCAPGCEPDEFWEFDGNTLPECTCGNKPPAPSCCVTDDSTGFCVSDTFNPYPDCWMDEMCLDDDLCSHSSCQNNRCVFEQIPRGNLCETGTEDCVCIDGEPNWMELQRVCFDNGSSCEARSNGLCRSPSRWDYIDGENPPDCICGDSGLVLQPFPACCYVPDGKGGCYGEMKNPYQFCWDPNQCNDNDVCTMDHCGGNECINVHIPNQQRCDNEYNCYCYSGNPYTFFPHYLNHGGTIQSVPSSQMEAFKFGLAISAPEELDIMEIKFEIWTNCPIENSPQRGKVQLFKRDDTAQDSWGVIAHDIPVVDMNVESIYYADLEINHQVTLLPSSPQSSGIKELLVKADTGQCGANDYYQIRLMTVDTTGNASGLNILFRPQPLAYSILDGPSNVF